MKKKKTKKSKRLGRPMTDEEKAKEKIARDAREDYFRGYRKRWNYSGINQENLRKKREFREMLRRKFGAIFEHNGETYKTRTVLCDEIGISASTFNVYQWKGIIPKSIYHRKIIHTRFGEKMGCFYSTTQIALLRKAFPLYRKKRAKLGRVKEYLHDNWTRNEKNFGGKGNDGSD